MMHAPGRKGFSLVELVVVMLVAAILAGFAAPLYRKAVYRARAATILSDFRTVELAVHQFHADSSRWPADNWRGRFPSELESYIGGVQFEGQGYRLDFDHWLVAAGGVVGISADIDDGALESAFLAAVRGYGDRLLRLNDRYMYVIARL